MEGCWEADVGVQVVPKVYSGGGILLCSDLGGIPCLRAHLQSPRALQSLAGMVGKFLCADKDAMEFTRPGVTRVYVEVDFSKPLPKQLWIDNGGELFA